MYFSILRPPKTRWSQIGILSFMKLNNLLKLAKSDSNKLFNHFHNYVLLKKY
ncbi:hypothetical protein SNE23_28245 (plasmid) [Bacillus sp. RA(2023)]|uniref:hypothetical protein n=1 Tax=Bacillus TaxID=1386 RepID=UPI0012F7440E|nr:MULTISPECIES: hypothetical protein [Bacillus]WPU78010.1 hypothetical protein SNE23_28245 [Bacillus sp. RA(2023)]